MATAKDIYVAPISQADAAKIVKQLHYSGKVVINSQLHLGVFLNGRLEGALQFGPSLDKRKVQTLVAGTGWNGFLELNRMAFSDRLPRNSESRAIGIDMRMIKKNYPHIDWIISYSDGTQCGDGTIYRGSGFVLTGINKNTTIWASPDNQIFSDIGLRTSGGQIDKAAKIVNWVTLTNGIALEKTSGASSMKAYKNAGFRPLKGFQLRYIYFLNPAAKSRLTVPIIPFSKIDEIGAGMYKGKPRVKQANSGNPLESGGAAPTHTLHNIN